MRHSRTVCRAFRKRSEWVWQAMDDAFHVPIGLNEETITEMLLLELAREFAGRGIEVRSFTKAEEGKRYLGGPPTGADWEWRFEGPTGLGKTVRIQAKRLYMSEGNYGGLDGTGNQRATLVSSSGAAIPLYVLYNGPSPKLVSGGRAEFPFLDRYGPKFCYWPYYDLELWGCAIAAEPDVPPKNKPAPADFAKMEPWHALVCDCAHDGSGDLGSTISQNLKEIYGASSASDLSMLNFEADADRPIWANALLEEQVTGGFAEILPANLQGVALIRQID